MDLTDYDALINKEPVQTAMVAEPFTTAEHVKEFFDLHVAQEKALESLPLLEAFNTAPDAATIGSLIGIHQIIFGSTDYLMYKNTVGSAAQLAIQTAMLAPTFLTTKEIQMAFVVGLVGNRTFSGLAQLMTTDAVLLGLATSANSNEFGLLPSTDRYNITSAVYWGRPIADQTKIILTVLNTTATADYIGKLISINSSLLGLNLTDYNALEDKNPVHNALINSAVTSVAELKTAFDEAVANQKTAEAVTLATTAVVASETSNLQADVDAAQALVTALPDGAAKTELQGRIDTVQAVIDAA